MRFAGLGFLIIAILLLAFPVINYFIPNEFYKYSIPIVALIFCTGLFVFNYLLYRNTKADTPWKGSLYAMIAQKARKLESDDITELDAKYLAGYLQEFFESTKSRGIEPANNYFTEAKILIKGLNTYPFGLTKDDV